MKPFMVEITLSGLPAEKVAALMPEEDRIVKELTESGIVQALYVHADLSGAYIVGQAESGEALVTHLSRLPMYPHMQIKVVPLLVMG